MVRWSTNVDVPGSKPANESAMARGWAQLDAYAQQIAEQFNIACENIQQTLFTY
jgi:hypothetical protein